MKTAWNFPKVGLLSAAALLVCCLAPAQGYMIIINDPSFETGPSLIPYSTTLTNQWQETFINGNAVGEVTSTAAMFDDATPDGSRFSWINNNNTAFQGFTNTLSAGTYVLSVWLGERKDLSGVGWSPSVGQFDLQAASSINFSSVTTLTPTTFTNNVPGVGQWVRAIKTYTIASDNPLIGEQLVVNLTNPLGGNSEAGFDMVTLEIVPEPASLTLAALGMAFLALTVRRRANR